MKKSGILNPQINRVLSELDHRDMLIIADAGLPVPLNFERICFGLKYGIHSFKEVLSAILPETEVEETYMTKEIIEKNPRIINFLSACWRKILAR